MKMTHSSHFLEPNEEESHTRRKFLCWLFQTSFQPVQRSLPMFLLGCTTNAVHGASLQVFLDYFGSCSAKHVAPPEKYPPPVLACILPHWKPPVHPALSSLVPCLHCGFRSSCNSKRTFVIMTEKVLLWETTEVSQPSFFTRAKLQIWAKNHIPFTQNATTKPHVPRQEPTWDHEELSKL